MGTGRVGRHTQAESPGATGLLGSPRGPRSVPKPNTASHFPLLLPEAVDSPLGSGRTLLEACERGLGHAGLREPRHHERRGHREGGLAAQTRSVPAGPAGGEGPKWACGSSVAEGGLGRGCRASEASLGSWTLLDRPGCALGPSVPTAGRAWPRGTSRAGTCALGRRAAREWLPGWGRGREEPPAFLEGSEDAGAGPRPGALVARGAARGLLRAGQGCLAWL